MKRMSRVLSIVLVLCMLMGLIPVYASAATMNFSDVRANQWFYEPIKYVYEAGMMNGTDTAKFSPDQATTRGMLVTILYRLEGSPSVSGRCPFNDVGSDLYYRDPIVWASENGLVNGYSATTFGPDNVLTREQMATIMYRYSRYKAYSTLDEGDYTIYEDGDQVGIWSEDAMRWAIGSGLISGVSDTKLQPSGSATRAQIATVLMRYCENIVAPAGQCRVTFVRNDGSDGAYKMNVIAAGSTVTKPADPIRDQYGFSGWYKDASGAEKFDFNTPITHNLTLYAGWSAPDDQEGLYAVAPGEDTIYSITGMEIVNDTIEVTVNTNSTAVLNVEFFDEDGFDLFSVASQTPRYCEMTVISIPIEGDLPRYFVIGAQLFDLAGNARTERVYCRNYTSDYETFEEQEIADFEAERVLQFSESETDNFGVLSEDVIKIESSEYDNLLSVYEMSTYDVRNGEDNKIYVFENPDASVLNLAEGDRVLAKDINGTDYMFKVGTIENDEGTIMILPSADVELSEFYDVLKVNTNIEVKDLEPSGSNTDTLMEVADINNSWSASIGLPLEVELGNLELSGNFKLTGTIDLEITYDAKLFGRDYIYCSVISETKTELTAELVAELESPDADELNLPKTVIPTSIPGLNLYMQPQIPVEWKLSGGAKFAYTNLVKGGFVYDSNSGFQNVDEKTQAATLGVEGDVELKIGPKITFGVEFLEEVVDAKIDLHAGLMITATAKTEAELTNADSKHACDLCVEGECKWFVNAAAELSVFDVSVLEGDLFNGEGWVNFLKTRPGQFHFSIINSVDSIYGGKPHFGGGECKNVQWKTTIQTQDKNDNIVSGISIGIDRHNGAYYDSGSSTLTTYLYDGLYDLRAQIDGQWVSKTLNVNQAAQTVMLSPNTEDGGVKGKVCDSQNDEAIVGAEILVTQNDAVIKSAVTDSNGDYSLTLPSGTYYLAIKKRGYISFETVVTVEDSEINYMQTVLLVMEDQKMGGFGGMITDAVTGEWVEDVRLEIRKGWNNTSEGDIIDVLYTNDWGEYEYDTFTLFGITIGLPAGNYTLNASKEGYVDMSFNVVVHADLITYGQDAVISPEMSGEVYRIVLNWGNAPSDLDSHLNARTDYGYREHIYYNDQYGYAGNLDRDDIDSYGPETITVDDLSLYDGGFTYSVHDYTNQESANSRALSQSDAYITIYQGADILRTIYVPYNRVGTVWNVFSIDENGAITILNTFENIEDPSDVGLRYL